MDVTRAIVLVVVTMTVVCNGAKAQSTSGCTSVLVGLAPCLNYITGNSTTPSSSCCSKLANVVEDQPQCLCAALNGGASALGLAINQTLAMSLPGACNVQTPPVSRCNGAAAPALAPTPDVSDASPLPNIPEGNGGSKTVPSTTTGENGSDVNRISVYFTLFVLFFASCFSNMIM